MNPADTIEDYARILAALDDPFADESRVLAQLGLTRATFAPTQHLWATRLAASGSASDLARAFTAAYAAARRNRPHDMRASVVRRDASCTGDEETIDLLGVHPEENFPFQAPVPTSDEPPPWR